MERHSGVAILGAPLDLGAARRGVDMGPSALRYSGLEERLSSLGLKVDDPLPIDEKEFPLEQAEYVYDMIYKPAKTAFLAAAEAHGCFIANGLGMLLYQGARALEIWSGREAPIQEMQKALTRHIYV